MIFQTPTHIYLGPRPRGVHEVVDRSTGRVDFLPAPPPNLSPISQLFTIDDHPPFTSFTLDHLRALRLRRTTIVLKLKGTRKKKDTTNATSDSSFPTTPRKRKLSSTTTHLLSTLDPAVAATLRGLF